MNTKELQEKREKLVAEARERLDQITSSTEETRAKELEAQHDDAMSALDALDANIVRAQRVEAEERKMEEAREAVIRSRRPTFTATEATTTDASEEYRSAFHAYIAAGGSEAALDTEHRSILAETRAQLTLSGAAGGYTVPTQMLPQLVEALKAYGPLYNDDVVFTLKTVGGAPIQIPTLDDTGNTSTAAHTEGDPLVDDGSGDAVFGKKMLGAYSYATPFVRISRELADDSILAVEAIINKLLGTRMGRTANHFLTVGTGSGQPTGIVTGASNGITTASAVAFTADEIIDLFHSLDPAYRDSAKAAFMGNDHMLAAVRKLKDSNNRYIWSNGDIQAGVPASLLGKKFYVNQDMVNAAANAKPIIFGDLSQFMVRKAGDPLIGSVADSKFFPGVGVAGYLRFDSAVLDPRAIKAMVMAAS